MPYWFRISKGFISPQSIIYFIKETLKTDLVILNQPNFEGLFLAIVVKLFNKKIISIFHCQVFLESNMFTKIINLFLNLSMKTQLFLSDKIVVYTKDYVNSLPYFKKFANKIVDVLPPIEKSVTDKKFLIKLLKLKKNNIWIGYAGRISSEKGLKYLVQSMKQLNNETIALVFAGPYGKNVAGENNYYKKIINILREYKIKHIFLGNLTSKQLSAFYRSIDVLVLPSINQTEAFGMVQAEAMIVGTPVIASNLPGVRMPIKLTKMGIIVEPRNSDQISKAIEEILGNKNKFTNDELIKNANIIFDIKKVYKFYDQLLTLIN
ncbi:MAG: glycosyltransferase family 4 protein [Patescibacteria group bacterium]